MRQSINQSLYHTLQLNYTIISWTASERQTRINAERAEQSYSLDKQLYRKHIHQATATEQSRSVRTIRTLQLGKSSGTL